MDRPTWAVEMLVLLAALAYVVGGVVTVRRAATTRTQDASGGAQEGRRAVLGATPDLGATRTVSEASEPVLRLSVPMPPSTNRLYATVNGRRVKTREAREYAEMVRQRVWLWKKLKGDPPAPPYRLTIELHPPTRRRLDVSNSIKCLEDGLFAGLEGNDRTVVEVIARLGNHDPLTPCADVTLEHVE